MSDDYIVVVPRNPRCIPAPEVQRRVAEILGRLVPEAADVLVKESDEVRFFDCGENFERIACPRCAGEINLEWWHERMDQDGVAGGFRLDTYALPCCGVSATLNDLNYEWPQAFGRFRWEIRNPDIGDLTSADRAALAAAAGVQLVFVRRRL